MGAWGRPPPPAPLTGSTPSRSSPQNEQGPPPRHPDRGGASERRDLPRPGRARGPKPPGSPGRSLDFAASGRSTRDDTKGDGAAPLGMTGGWEGDCALLRALCVLCERCSWLDCGGRRGLSQRAPRSQMREGKGEEGIGSVPCSSRTRTRSRSRTRSRTRTRSRSPPPPGTFHPDRVGGGRSFDSVVLCTTPLRMTFGDANAGIRCLMSSRTSERSSPPRHPDRASGASERRDLPRPYRVFSGPEGIGSSRDDGVGGRRDPPQPAAGGSTKSRRGTRGTRRRRWASSRNRRTARRPRSP